MTVYPPLLYDILAVTQTEVLLISILIAYHTFAFDKSFQIYFSKLRTITNDFVTNGYYSWIMNII